MLAILMAHLYPVVYLIQWTRLWFCPQTCQKQSLQGLQSCVWAITVIPVGQSKFYKLWCSLVTSIDTMKPSSDLCFECQQNISQIMRSAHLSEEAKSELLRHAEAHFHLAKVERERYMSQTAECKNPNINNYYKMHYSFDYAQQVHFSSNPQQPGPAFFLTARKCQIFGVACEPLVTQVNYLIDESESVGRGQMRL